jgi:predicted ester cyclase
VLVPGKEVLPPQFITANRAAFPDLRLTIEDQIAEGDKVVTRFTARGTHRGKLPGIAPTGKQVTTTAIIINRYTGGKIAESWINGDILGLLQQLGVIPRMAQAGA